MKTTGRTVSILVRADGSIEGMEEARAAIIASPGALKSWAHFFGRCEEIALQDQAKQNAALKKAA